MRTTLRQLWHQEPLRRNVIVAKVLDVVVLVGIGLAIAASLVVTSVATAAADVVIDHTPLTGGSVTEVLLRILAIALALAGDVLLYAFLFLRLPEPGGSRRDILGGAVFGAIGFEILKSVGAIYIAHTTHNPLYASFAVVIGLLVWTNLVARLFLFAAAWAVTAPYDSDVSPSGTAGSLRVDAVPVPVAAEVHPPGWALARIAGTADRRDGRRRRGPVGSPFGTPAASTADPALVELRIAVQVAGKRSRRRYSAVAGSAGVERRTARRALRPRRSRRTPGR